MQSLTAGVDIGNATTEVVIADPAVDPPRPVLWDRRPTLGGKGSAKAADAAAALLARMGRRLGQPVAQVVLTPQVAAQTSTSAITKEAPDTGGLRVLVDTSGTSAGVGVATGRPVPVGVQACAGPVVLVAQDPLGYRETVRHVRRWHDSGADVRGVLLAGDEARLVGARIGAGVPIVDGIDTAVVLAGREVALEVAPTGGVVRHLADPIWLSGHLTEESAEVLRAVAGLVAGSAAAVIVVGEFERPPRAEVAVAEAEPADRWYVDLSGGSLPRLRPGVLQTGWGVLATLGDLQAARAFPEAFEAAGREVVVRSSETASALAGAVTTSGGRDADLVVDLGGGTVDLLTQDRHITGAGCGIMLTRAVGRVLGISDGTAEWVKRGPSMRIEGPEVASDEAGVRHFLDATAPGGTVGWLTVEGPSGRLPFHRDLTASEWRQVRQALKYDVIVANLRRLIPAPDLADQKVLLVGGPAHDDELLDLLAMEFPTTTFGRANIADVLGPRWAVAYGLLLTP